MSDIPITQHAARRLQQRGIPESVLPILIEYGEHEYDKRGAKLIYLSQRSRQRLRHSMEASDYRRLERALDIYAVVSDGGAIVTVGHRTHRINRN